MKKEPEKINLEKSLSELEKTLSEREKKKLIQERKVNIIEREIDKITAPYGFFISNIGLKKIETLISKYDMKDILDAVDISGEKYLPDKEMFIGKIKGICYLRSIPPVDQKCHYLSSVLSKKFQKPKWMIKNLIDEYISILRDNWNYDDAAIIADLEDEVLNDLGKEVWNFYDFRQRLIAWMSEK